jgi:hypothetical protein
VAGAAVDFGGEKRGKEINEEKRDGRFFFYLIYLFSL